MGESDKYLGIQIGDHYLGFSKEKKKRKKKRSDDW